MSIIGFMQLINVATYLVDLVKKGDVKNINDYLDDYKQFPKYIIKNAMNSTDDLEIKELETLNFDKTILGFDQKEIDNLFKDVLPVFEPANNNFQNVDMGEIKAPNSQVRMVQLFLDSTSEPKLKEMIDYLKSVYKIDNLTDTVFKAVENEYNNSKANT